MTVDTSNGAVTGNSVSYNGAILDLYVGLYGAVVYVVVACGPTDKSTGTGACASGYGAVFEMAVV